MRKAPLKGFIRVLTQPGVLPVPLPGWNTPLLPRIDLRNVTAVRAGGLSLVLGAIAFVGVFSYLAANFSYPEVLDGAATEVLPRLLATGPSGRFVWALYGFLPL